MKWLILLIEEFATNYLQEDTKEDIVANISEDMTKVVYKENVQSFNTAESFVGIDYGEGQKKRVFNLKTK